jgi:hypothetical protein
MDLSESPAGNREEEQEEQRRQAELELLDGSRDIREFVRPSKPLRLQKGESTKWLH